MTQNTAVGGSFKLEWIKCIEHHITAGDKRHKWWQVTSCVRHSAIRWGRISSSTLVSSAPLLSILSRYICYNPIRCARCPRCVNHKSHHGNKKAVLFTVKKKNYDKKSKPWSGRGHGAAEPERSGLWSLVTGRPAQLSFWRMAFKISHQNKMKKRKWKRILGYCDLYMTETEVFWDD